MGIIVSYVKEDSGFNAGIYFDWVLEAKNPTIHVLLAHEFEGR
jgi:hypothetical protein